MPTDKPRVTVTLPDQVHEVISQWAKLQGVSRGAVISEMMQAVYPAMVRAAGLMQAAAEAPRSVQDGLAETFLDIHEEFAGQYQRGLFEMDRQTLKLQRGSAKARERSRPTGDSTPVPVTRGSGVDNSRKKPVSRKGRKS